METKEGMPEISGKIWRDAGDLGGTTEGTLGPEGRSRGRRVIPGGHPKGHGADAEGTALGTPTAKKGRERDTDRRGTAGGTRTRPGDTRRDTADSKGTLLGTFWPPEGHFRGRVMALSLTIHFVWRKFEIFPCFQILP